MRELVLTSALLLVIVLPSSTLAVPVGHSFEAQVSSTSAGLPSVGTTITGILIYDTAPTSTTITTPGVTTIAELNRPGFSGDSVS